MKIKKKTMWILFIILAVIFTLWIAYGYFAVRSVENLSYRVLESDKEYEIRQIEGHLVAETSLQGTFDTGGSEAFRIVAGYIFGDNKKKQKIAMTTPVIQEESEPIAMTTPVIFEDETKNRTFSFVMPSKYTLETLPEPVDSRVKIIEVAPYRVAALRFIGFYSDKNYSKHREQLRKYLERDGLKYSGMLSAGYNPPWTPPFMTRMEVWAILEK